MRPIEKTSEDLFQKLRSRFSPITLGDENAESTADPMKARIFNFMYKEGDSDIGYVSISLTNNRALKVYYGNDVLENVSNKADWYHLLRDLRGFAKRNLLAFDARDLAKNQLEPRDFKFISQQDGSYKDHEVEITESTMFGSRRKSYQAVESVKMIINHRRSIDETVPGARSRYIESIFLERSDGERYKFPYNYLTGARAMARHVAEGGNPYDNVGKHILDTIKEMRDLSKFARRTKKHAMENSDANSVRSSVIERFQNLKKTLGAMSVKEGYDRFVENFSTEETLAENETLQQLKERFTQQVFDTQLEDTLPAVMRAIKEAEMKQVVEASPNVEKLIKNTNWPLVLRKDDAADSLFKSTKFTDGKGLLGFILSDIAGRAIGDDADAVANFASDAAERIQDPEYDAKDKQLAMMLAKRYMDDVKKMSADSSYVDTVRMDPKDIYGAKKKRTGGFHEAEAYEAWANETVSKEAEQVDEISKIQKARLNAALIKTDPKNPVNVAKREREAEKEKSDWYNSFRRIATQDEKESEDSVKKKSDLKTEATTQGTVGTTGTSGTAAQKPTQGQLLRDPKLQQAAKNVSRVTQAAGIKTAPSQIAQTMAAQSLGKMPSRQGMQTIGGLGNTIMQAAANDPRKAAQLTAMMKKMVTQGKFDEAAVRGLLQQNLREAPAQTFTGAAAMKNPTQRPYDVNNQGRGQVKVNVPTGASPNFGNKMAANAPMSTADAAKASMAMKNPTQRPYNASTSFSTGSVTGGAGITPLNKVTLKPSTATTKPTTTSAVPIPTSKPSNMSVIQKGGNVWNTFKGQFGRAPTQAELGQIAKASGIKDINKVMPGQKLDFSKIK